jgi:PAS domain S-box-containing protein
MEEVFNKRILIVEDNSDLLTGYSRILSKAGYLVSGAENGKEALEFIDQETFALVILDVMLPDLSGLEVLTSIKSNPKHDNLFVILISSLATSSANQSEGLESGADGYVVTPISNREFLARIEAFIRHKWTTDKLRASEAKYQKLFKIMRLMSDTMPDMLWAKDLNKQFIFANKSICENLLYAKDTDEPIGKTDSYFAARERESRPSDSSWYTFDQQCTDSDSVVLNELREMQFHEHGNVRSKLLHLEVHKAPLYNEGGKLIGIVGSARDITSRKHTEASLLESESLLRESQSIARLGSFTWNIETDLWKSSEILDKIFGIDEKYPRTLEGWICIVHPEWRSVMYDYVVNDVLRDHKKFDKEYKIIRADDGTERWVHGLGLLTLNQDNKPLKLVGTISDISDRKLSECAIIESEKNYRTLFEKMSQGVFYQMADGSISDVNEAALRICGLSRDEFLGRTSYHSEWKVISEDGKLLVPEEHPSMIALLSGKPCENRIIGVFNAECKRVRWIVVNAIPQFIDGESVPAKVFVTLHDITSLKETEEALKLKMNELERFNVLTIGRELKMIELKREINTLLNKLGEKDKYKIVTRN